MEKIILLSKIGSRLHNVNGSNSDWDFQVFLPYDGDHPLSIVKDNVNIFKCDFNWLKNLNFCMNPLIMVAFNEECVGPISSFVKKYSHELLNMAPNITYNRTIELIEHDKEYEVTKRIILWTDILKQFLDKKDFSQCLEATESCKESILLNKDKNWDDVEGLKEEIEYLKSKEVYDFFNSYMENISFKCALSEEINKALTSDTIITEDELQHYAECLTEDKDIVNKIVLELSDVINN